ncbi:MAG: type IX secretion system PorP/SprF family membrane protein [Arenicella sp.]|jgi:type IX secretion system PorP/SprF family membrane protein
MKNMKLKTIIFSIALVTMGYESLAQQLPESNLYTFNKYNINPAYSGFNDCLELNGSHLSQWVGIDGAPSTNYFSAHSGLGENMGIGGGIILDKAAFISRFSAKASYAYRIKLGDDHNLRFGLSAGLFQVKVDATSAIVDDVTDEVVSGGAQSGMNFNSDFGIFYNLKGFQLGVSIPQVFETEAKLQFQGIDGFTEKRHYIAYAGYDLQLNDKWSAEPSLMYKTAQSGLSQLDINAMVTYNKFISVGAGYRTHVGVLARLGVNIKDQFMLGYAYEFAGANISSYGSGSHEIMLGIKFCKEVKPANMGSFETGESAPDLSEEIVEEVEEVTEEAVEEEIEKAEEVVVEEVIVEEAIEEMVVEEVIEEKVPDFKETYKPKILFPYNDGENFDLSTNDDLKVLANYLKENKDQKITIVGYACNIGSKEQNITISEHRAKKVNDELIKMGVSSNQLSTKAKGQSEPLFPNTSDENRQKNRRVEILFEN